jgi:glutathione S-transferase
MLTVYGRATSSNVQAVMWGAAELGLEVERLDYGHVYGGVDTPEFLAMNPNGRVPVLRDGELVLWESCAILRYLAARYGDGGAFWPADPVARAPVDQWAEWGKVTFAAAFIHPIFWPLVRKPARERDAVAVGRAIDEFIRLAGILEAQIGEGPWVMGEAFTLADIVCGHALYRWFTLDIDRPPAPGLEAYYARLTRRPAYRAHVMVDYAPLRHPEA